MAANFGSSDLSVFQLDRRSGDLTLIDPSVPAGFAPSSPVFTRSGTSLFVATRSTQPGVTKDEILGFRVNRRGRLKPRSVTPAGIFLTDIALSANGHHLVVGTASTDFEDQVLEFRRRARRLELECAGIVGQGNNLTGKSVATVRLRGNTIFLVTEISNNTIRSLTE